MIIFREIQWLSKLLIVLANICELNFSYFFFTTFEMDIYIYILDFLVHIITINMIYF